MRMRTKENQSKHNHVASVSRTANRRISVRKCDGPHLASVRPACPWECDEACVYSMSYSMSSIKLQIR
jgi:hypothetical protein